MSGSHNAHSNLGPSSAHRWLACPGSVAAIAALPTTDETSPWAAEGTKAHDLAEIILRGYDIDPDEYEQEMFDYVQVYVDYVNQLGKEADAVIIEERVDFSEWVQDGFGTADAIIVQKKTLHVVDLKYGMGVRVDADENPQGMLYALGAYALTEITHEIEQFVIHIVQPRLDHITAWSISISDLLSWAEWVRERAEIALSDDAPRVPGEKQCKFCEVKGSCKALMKHVEKITMMDFDDLDDAPNPDTMTDDDLRLALESKGLIEGWLTAVAEVVQSRLDDGQEFEGFKLVEGRSFRQWENEQDAEATLIDLFANDAYTKKLLSPAQAEKKLGKAKKHLVEELIVKPRGKPTLAPEADKRPAINATAEDFDDLD